MPRLFTKVIICLVLGCVFAPFTNAEDLCEYTIVERSSDPENEAFGLWIICSQDTTLAGCQVAARCAAKELHELYGTELTSIYVILRPEYAHLGIYYAGARFSAKGRGSKPLGNRFYSGDWRWREFVAERTLTEVEAKIADLWVANKNRFPPESLFSSQSYDRGALRKFIANELDIGYEETELPKLPTKETID